MVAVGSVRIGRLIEKAVVVGKMQSKTTGIPYRQLVVFHMSDAVRSEARAIAKDIAALDLGTPLREHGTSSTGMLAWLATSVLRKPIQLVPVDDSGAAPRLGDPKGGTVIDRTYDKVDLLHPRQSIAGRNPEPALLIGMDVLGLLDTLIIDYRRKELQVKLRRG